MRFLSDYVRRPRLMAREETKLSQYGSVLTIDTTAAISVRLQGAPPDQDRVRRRSLPSLESGRPTRGDFSGRSGPKEFPGNARPDVHEDWMASARLLPDEQSFSSRGGDSTSKSSCRHEMVARELHDALQSPASLKRSFICRTLQITSDRWHRPCVFADSL